MQLGDQSVVSKNPTEAFFSKKKQDGRQIACENYILMHM